MAENQTFSDIIDGLTPGMVVDANGEIAVIVDILRSQFTETVCLFVRFPRNVGNARPYDVLEVSPERTLGVEQWRPATQEALEERLVARRHWLEGELSRLREMVASSTFVREPAASD